MGGTSHETTFQQLIDDYVLAIADGYRARNVELGGDGPIFLRAGHVGDDCISFVDAERFHAGLSDKVAAKLSRPGDVIITTKGNSTGRTAYVNADMPPFVYSPHLSYWRSLDPAALAPGYLRYWAISREFTTQLGSMAFSTDMAPYLSLTDQRRLRLALPPLPEQRAIAHILGTLDDKIELNRKMNETLEAMARAIFKSWFVDFDPVWAKKEGRQPYGMDADTAALFPDDFEDSEMGLVPKGWELKPLDEVADFLNGIACQKYPAESDESLPVIKIRELRQGFTENTDRASLDVPKDRIIEDGDVLFSWSGSLEALVWWRGRGVLNQHVFKVTSEAYPKWFYFQWVLQHLREFRGIAADKATTMGHIKREHLSQAMVAVPPPDALALGDRAIAPLLEAAIARALESRTLTELRDALLPKLMSGELRVSDAERVVGDMV